MRKSRDEPVPQAPCDKVFHVCGVGGGDTISKATLMM